MTDASGTVVVVGSVNVDDIYEVESLPTAGETVINATFRRLGGGKGANQAAAAATAADRVVLFGAVGDDSEGTEALAELADLGVDVRHVATVGSPTGRAAVVTTSVGSGAENQIVVASGANADMDARLIQDMFRSLDFPLGTVCLICAEIPDEAIAQAATEASARGFRVVFNAAPARPLPDPLVECAPILVVNESEAKTLSGASSLEQALAELVKLTNQVVVATLGAKGVVVAEPGRAVGPEDLKVRPAPEVSEVLDTTGAGDAFCGVLAARLQAGRSLDAAVQDAQRAGAKAVSSVGARGWLET